MRLFLSTILLTVALASPPAALAQQRPAGIPDLGANLPAQPVGPNDLLSVSVYDAPELSRTVRVGADGFFRLPMLKQLIRAQGLLPAEIEAAIVTALQQEQVLVAPFVTVNIAEYHSRPISVAGAVKMPLVFQADGPTSLLEAIARAQGLREDAGSEILVSQTQPGPDEAPITLTRRIPVRGLIDDADPALNLHIFVVGNVKKPGAFAIRETADTSVLQMIALAEGLAPYSTKEAYIYRREGSGSKNEIAVPLDKIMARKAADVPLIANDILYIPDNKGKRMTLGALEKILGLGTALGAASIYVMR